MPPASMTENWTVSGAGPLGGLAEAVATKEEAAKMRRWSSVADWPPESCAVKVTVKDPGVVYVWIGFLSVEAAEPSPKSQS